MKKLPLLIVFFLAFSQFSSAQNWFGNRISNTSVFVDPTEVQMSGTVAGVLNQDLGPQEYQFIPFGIGAGQSLYSNNSKSYEILAEFGTFTQFEWINKEGKQERNLFNTDYRIALSWIKIIKNSSLRFRFFHVSSHLGDDYIIRNQIRYYTENRVNYEQLDFTYFRNINADTRYSAGIGYVIRPNSPRKPFSSWASITHNRFGQSKFGLTTGANWKAFEETDFKANIKIALGLAYQTGNPEPLRLVLEYFNGNMPYSQFEQSDLSYLGLGLYFYIQ